MTALAIICYRSSYIMNFIHRVLYKDLYWMLIFTPYLSPLFVTYALKLRHVSF